MSATVDDRNAETSRQEVENFKTDEPGPYFAYHKAAVSRHEPHGRLTRGDKVTTWTGDVLASVVRAGDTYQCTFGDERQNFRALGINGATYTGTAYLSAGDYVRMRPVKG